MFVCLPVLAPPSKTADGGRLYGPFSQLAAAHRRHAARISTVIFQWCRAAMNTTPQTDWPTVPDCLSESCRQSLIQQDCLCIGCGELDDVRRLKTSSLGRCCRLVGSQYPERIPTTCWAIFLRRQSSRSLPVDEDCRRPGTDDCVCKKGNVKKKIRMAITAFDNRDSDDLKPNFTQG